MINNLKHPVFLLSIFLLLVIISFPFLYSFITNKEATPLLLEQTKKGSLLRQFKPSLLLWSQATSSAEWKPRDSAASFVFQNKIWTMGGLNGNGDVNSNNTINYWEAPHFNDIWTSEDGVIWKLVKVKAEWAPRRSMSVVLFQDKLWMFGGWSPVGGYTNDIWESSDGISWTKIASKTPWTAREGQTTEVFQGKMWMMGGVNYDERETKNDVWYSENGIDWYQAATTIPWSSRWDHATAVFNGKIFLTGGMNLSKQVFNDVWVSSDGLRWELINTNQILPDRQGHSLIPFQNKLWLIGRFNDKDSGGINDVWYSDDGIVWQKTDTDPLWAGREDHSALLFKDRIYVFGGMDANWRWRNDVWFSSN